MTQSKIQNQVCQNLIDYTELDMRHREKLINHLLNYQNL